MFLILISISTNLAGFYSLVLPGLGDILLGNKDRGKSFMIAEGMIWTNYIVFNVLGNDVRNDYIKYAYIKASSNPSRKDEDYLEALEWFRSMDDYNDYIKEYARYLYGDSVEARKKYIEEHQFSDEDYWKWEEDKDFMKFIELRKKSRSYFNTARNIASLAVVNRIVSFVLTSYFSDRFSIIIEKNGVRFVWKID
uniref:DUF5683 domain-containing protein n=1 Tax=candidate division WOR-3 bacterium TaxID=2052148 RepID=A0A7C4Y618_UNCW3